MAFHGNGGGNVAEHFGKRKSRDGGAVLAGREVEGLDDKGHGGGDHADGGTDEEHGQDDGSGAAVVNGGGRGGEAVHKVGFGNGQCGGAGVLQVVQVVSLEEELQQLAGFALGKFVSGLFQQY